MDTIVTSGTFTFAMPWYSTPPKFLPSTSAIVVEYKAFTARWYPVLVMQPRVHWKL